MNSRGSRGSRSRGHPGAGPRRRARQILQVLRVHNFALFWTGQLISGTGTWMQTVAMAWLVLQVSRSPATLGLITSLQFLPMLILVLPAGVVADRFPKRVLLLAAQLLATAQALLLGFLAAAGTPQIWQLAVLAVALGVSNAFNNPAQQAFIPEMVGRPLIPDAVAMNSVQFNATRMVGSAAGGLAVAQLPVATVFFINAASFAASLLALLSMRAAELHLPPRQPASHGALREGLRYAINTPSVLFVLPASLALMGLAGFSGTIFTTSVNSRLQGLVPDLLRGRVMSLFVLLIAGTTPVGSSLLGLGADAIGASATITGFGLATAAGLAVLGLLRATGPRWGR